MVHRAIRENSSLRDVTRGLPFGSQAEGRHCPCPARQLNGGPRIAGRKIGIVRKLTAIEK